MKTELMTILPKVAEEWLTRHFDRVAKGEFRQRPISQVKAEQYARDMAAGHWIANHQGIGFDKDENLVDGQHRLLGIKICGKPIKMLVTTGLDSNGEVPVMDTIDCGKPRSVRDQLQISHVMPNAYAVQASVRGIVFIALGFSSKFSLSVSQTLAIRDMYEDDITPTTMIGRCPAYVNSVIAMYHHAFPNKGDEFIDKFTNLVGLAEGHPIQIYMKWLRMQHSKMMAAKKAHAFRMFINCVYKYHEGESINSLRPADEADEWIIRIQGKDIKRIHEIVGPKQTIVTQDSKVTVKHQA